MALAVQALLIFLLAAPAAYAAVHTVGGTSGWNQATDYTTWADGENFTVGDTLVFNYDNSHKVDIVSKADYDNCGIANAIKTYDDGKTSIPLTVVGPMYFLCPVPGHCTQGQKLMITVSAPTPGGGAPSATPSTPGTPPPPTVTPATPSPPPASGASCSLCNMNSLMLGCSLILAVLIGFMG